MSYNINDLFVARNSRSGYQIEQSLRFDNGAYLNRTQTTDNQANDFTVSFWLKKAYNGPDNMALFHMDNDPLYSYIAFGESSGDDDQLIARGTSSGYAFRTDRKYRDPSAWLHLVLSVEVGVITKGWINGVLDSSSGATSGWRFNGAYSFAIGRQQHQANSPFNGYMAEFHFVDGSALDATDFGEFDNNGVWRPIEVSGLTYGTNGYYLKFDPSATNGIGHDHSGNGNNWTPSGFTTSGTGTDVMDDTPTTNWCTLNPIDSGGSGITISEGNLKTVSTSSDRHVRSTFFLPTSGKWYWEMTATTVNTAGYLGTGLYHATGSLTASAAATAQGRWYLADGYGNGSSWGATYDDGDIIGIAVDMDSGKIWAAKNNTWQASGDPVAGTNPMYDDLLTAYSDIAWSPVCANFQHGNTANFNFGQRDFEYTPPSGYLPLNTANLPAPTVKDGSKNFKPLIYLPDGSSSFSVTGVGFQPDFVWIKSRNYAEDHQLNDAVRGATKALQSNLNSGETTQSNGLTSFDSDGFTVGNLSDYNYSGDSIISWNWKAGGSGSSNTDGSITSTVSANPTAGFSIVSYTGNGNASATIGHGLGVKPQMVIVKSRSNSSTYWTTYHESISAGTTYCLELNTRAYKDQVNGAFFGSTQTFNSTVFSVGYPGAASNSTNVNTYTYIAYCFAEVEGYSKFGSFTGNGSSDGSFVYCGFRPAWIMLKRATGGQESWQLVDTARRTYNPMTNYMSADTSNAEASAVDFWDQLSNGFKLRNGGVYVNGSGDTYVFAAFAENPFGGDGVSPATAR